MSCHCRCCQENAVNDERAFRVTVLERLKNIEERLTTMANDIDTILDAIDTETTAIAAELKKLTDEIAAANANALTSAQKARADSLIARLTVLGSDPANPVPNPLPSAPATEPVAPPAAPTV